MQDMAGSAKDGGSKDDGEEGEDNKGGMKVRWTRHGRGLAALFC